MYIRWVELRGRAKEGRHPEETWEEWPLEPGGSWSYRRAAWQSSGPPTPDLTGGWRFRELAWCSVKSRSSGYRVQRNVEQGRECEALGGDKQRLGSAGCLWSFLRNPFCLDAPGPSKKGGLGKQIVMSQV